MNREVIFLEIKKIVLENFDVDPNLISENMNITKDLGADFIDLAEFIVELENEFDEQISNTEAEGIDTLGQLVDLIIDRTKKTKKSKKK
ncbi:acyl carrier protein [Lactobacillus sp. S2-2]|uniref:acyl carrier protein n=1 Tax=Lactobacillus sp. S2-2 TaxID=2692917 RepID=UPI001F2C5B76|nr:acyl carrier protein [Lactobacillus sp. S2-2]MCF6515089.1 acyl carrier protein [Lactobacillus sp. S2-2]